MIRCKERQLAGFSANPYLSRTGIEVQRRFLTNFSVGIPRGEFLNLLSVAHGSVRELETHVILAGRLRLLAQATVADSLRRAAEAGRLVTGLANSLQR